MKLTNTSSNIEIKKELGSRIKNLRIQMNMTQKDLAARTALSLHTISNLENGNDVSFTTLIEVLRELGQLQTLDLLVPEVTLRPSQLQKSEKPRERASRKKSEPSVWKWGDEE